MVEFTKRFISRYEKQTKPNSTLSEAVIRPIKCENKLCNNINTNYLFIIANL